MNGCTVASYMEARSGEQCARRWEQLHPSSNSKRGKWTVDEDMVSVVILLVFRC